MLVLGVDTGKVNIGLAWYKDTDKSYGLLANQRADIYSIYFDKFKDIVKDISPDLVRFEKPFFTQLTITTNIGTLEVIGLQKLACQQLNIKYIEVSPKAVKKDLTGSGNATKDDIYHKLIELDFDIPKNNTHVADALAIAYTYSTKYGINR